MNETKGAKTLRARYFEGLSPAQITGWIFFSILTLIALAVGAICLRNAIKWVDKPFPGFLVNQRLVVGSIGQYYWTGKQAGIKHPDKILKANGRVISSPEDLEEVTKNTKIGEPVKYAIEREEQIIELTIPTMRFTGHDLVMTFGIVAFSGFLYLIIGAIVFILKPHTKVSWLFFSGCFLQSISNFVAFDIESTHFGFIRAYLFDDSFLPAVVCHFSLLFPEKSNWVERHSTLETIPYLISAALIIPIELLYPRPLFTTLYKFVLFYTNISVLAFILSILHSYFKKSSFLARQRAKVILFGAVLALPIPTLVPFVSFMGSTLGGTKILNNFSAIPLVIFPASIAYAIARHNLFDVDVYIKRAVGYAVMTALLGVAYLSMQVGVRTLILQPLFGDYADEIYPILFALLVVFLFNPISNRIQKVIDRLFYRLEYNYQETVRQISGAMRYLQSLDQIKTKIIDTILWAMFIDSCSILLANPEQKVYEGVNVSYDFSSRKLSLPDQNLLVQEVAIKKKEVTIYDIQEDLSYEKDREAFKRVFMQLDAAVVLPLFYENRLIGLMSLGNKRSGKFYRREDMNLLKTIANQGAVAIENARLAEQMKSEEKVRANFARYLSPQIVDQIIKKDVQVNLGGDRKVVTVLFSDIRNFTRISETLSPDQLVALLNEYFTEMARIIFENQGSLDKYIGDAIVAVFGSLITLENSSKTATQTAIQMMKQVVLLNQKWENQYGFAMNIGIGINTGEVFLGNVGSPDRMEFTVLGDTVNMASRFSGIAKEGQILITRETLECLSPDIKYRELSQTEVKGKTGRIEVFEIVY